MTTVYFFSRHEAQQKMVDDLGGNVSKHFKGTISNVHGVLGQNKIKFTETIGFGDDAVVNDYEVVKNAIFVIVGPLPLQMQWLQSGVEILLTPQNQKEIDKEGKTIFKYSGLLHVKEVRIVSEQWSGTAPTLEQKIKERSVLH